ncbi:MAG: hypothetical protein SF162_08330 [bacterium]|nr:hypothetical protein [bacterium]
MQKRLHYVLPCIVILVSFGCSNYAPSEIDVSELWLQSAPAPEFILELPREVWATRSSCSNIIVLDGYVIWENGNHSNDVMDAIINSLGLYIDNQHIDQAHLVYYEPIGTMNPQETGSFFPEIPVCVDLNNLSLGLHSAHIQFSSVAGIYYEHRWAFRLIAPPIP